MTREIRLLRLELRRFKGAEAFELDLDGSSAIVRGDNATGKTTLHDAYTWLLFGKDASNRSAFELKPLDETGSAESGVDHEVRGVFSIDGERVELERIYRETWTKKRGASKAELTGHTTALSIDGVPVKKKEWDERLLDLFGPEDRLRLLTDPLFFAGVLPWSKRREVLLELVGEVRTADLVRLEPELEDLERILGKRSQDEHRKVAESRRKTVNGELSRLPVRVDEARRALDGASEIPKKLDELVAAARAKVAELETASRPEGAAARSKARLEDARRKLAYLSGERKRARDATVYDHEREIGTVEHELSLLAREREQGEKTIARYAEALELATASLEKTRAAYAELRSAPVEAPPIETVCPCCRRELDPDALEVARRGALERANADRAASLRRLVDEGRERSTAVDATTTDLEELRASIEKIDERAGRFRKDLEALRAKLETARAEPTEPSPEELELIDAIAELEAAPADAPIDTTELETARAELDRLLALVARRAEIERATARIAELEKEEKELSIEVERLDRELYLLDLATRTRARILTDLVGEQFELVRFRLFDEQVNGALVEACDVTVEGVPWLDLNHGARMNAGIDLIRTLSAHYGLRAPVWLDNAESVTRWRDAGTQTIRLEVSESAPELELEILDA